MNTYQFGRIFLINSLLILTVNGLFYWQPFKALLAQRPVAISLGLALYVIQTLVTYRLAGRQKGWLIQPFQGRRLLQGFGAILLIEVMTIALISIFTTHSQGNALPSRLPDYLLVFIFNSLPGALLEEWLFRYLPLRFAQQSNQRFKSILLCLRVLIFFTLCHVPAYLLQHERSLTELGQVFVMGGCFLGVYLMTRNLFFTALFHGLTNNPLYLIESPYYWLYFYTTIAVVSVFWAFLNHRNQHKTLPVNP
ncbi:CPBP family intramembrane glutamic endopeptidase [Spirosoma linguale]|uniref:Abortive infection protein n=1 Tax=Spirosoma linguale (strain ATCC 33905 / DSM 74 / LMG 10896 / Claus 1) TaxID=504472 RepID=D2QJE2_SPILD|nr:Abortive infection protein [Spirosoma linguale DSM 74]